MYKCICGKYFKSINALNGHKSHCLNILGEEKWIKRNIEQMKRMSKIGNDTLQKEAEDKKKEELEKWISEQHTCEKCGKVMTEKYGSGRFCCRACANSRVQTDQINKKRSYTVLKNLKNKQNSEIEDYKRNSKNVSGYYNGIYCSSSYELIFLLYCIEHNIKIERCSFKFTYKYKNKNKIYIPDFYLPESNTVIELKGRGKFYNKKQVEEKNKAVKNSSFNFKIIYDDEFNNFYYTWAKDFYKFKNSEYKYFCISKYTNKSFDELQPISKKHVSRTKGYKKINNGEINTCVPEEKLNEYLNSGWQLGSKK